MITIKRITIDAPPDIRKLEPIYAINVFCDVCKKLTHGGEKIISEANLFADKKFTWMCCGIIKTEPIVDEIKMKVVLKAKMMIHELFNDELPK